jgi:hypothetical protein
MKVKVFSKAGDFEVIAVEKGGTPDNPVYDFYTQAGEMLNNVIVAKKGDKLYFTVSDANKVDDPKLE